MLFPSEVSKTIHQQGAVRMSTSLLYHAFGIRGYQYVATDYQEGGVRFRSTKELKDCRCSGCGSNHVASRGQVERQFRCLPIGHRPVTVVLPIPRVWCLNCGVIRQVALDVAEPRRSYTKGFARYALELCRYMTIQDVAHHLSVGWDLIKEIQKQDLSHRFGRPKLKQLRQLALDEIVVGRGHRYLTIVLDLESGVVVHVGRGKSAEALEAFWKRLRRCGAKIEAVATDMGPAYIEAVRRRLPNATLVFDRFQVMKLFNDKLAQLRRQLYQRATAEHRQVLKGVRWLLVKRPEHLDPARKERERLDEALQLNEPLATASYLKEELGEFWEQDDDAATAFLLDWLARAEASGLSLLVGLAKTWRKHALGLVAWYEYPSSTGPLEGTNNKSKTMQRQAYGYRDEEFFKLKSYAILEAKYALVG
jgi:transposase